MRKHMLGILLLAGLVFHLQAEEVSGKVKAIDADKYNLTLTIDGKDKVFPVDRDASIVSVMTIEGKKEKQAREQVKAVESLSAIKVGAQITVLTMKEKDKRDIITSIKVPASGIKVEAAPATSPRNPNKLKARKANKAAKTKKSTKSDE